MKRIRVWLFAVSALLHGAASLLFVLLGESARLPSQFDEQFFIGLLASVLGSLFLSVLNNKKATYILLAVKVVIVNVVGIPLGRNLVVELLLLTSTAFESVFYTEGILSTVLPGILVAVFAIMQREYLAWNVTVLRPSVVDVVFCGLTLVSLTVLAVAAKRTLCSLDRQTSRVAELESETKQLVRILKEFEDQAMSARQVAEINERKRITREIHDIIGYTLTNFIVMMESATDFAKTDSHKTEELIEKAREQAERGLEEIRYSLRLLRAPDQTDFQGIRAIQKLVDGFAQNTRTAISVEYGNVPWTFDNDLDSVVYFIVQEGLINALRHGHATAVKIGFWVHKGKLLINISDNGVGAKMISEGIGFSGIRERIERYDGCLDVVDGCRGFQLSVTIPLDEG